MINYPFVIFFKRIKNELAPRAKTLFLIFIFFLLTSFFPHNPLGRVKKFNTKNGFTLKVINCITQDKSKLMWFGAEDGLARFDGYNFKIFKNEPGNPNSLSNNFVQTILTDSEGFLWIGTLSGLNYFDPKTETFHTYYHQAKNKKSLIGDAIKSIYESKNGNLWVATSGPGFSYFDKKNKNFISYSPKTHPFVANHEPICIYEDSYGLLWLGYRDGGLDVFKVKDGIIVGKEKNLSKAPLPSLFLQGIIEDHLKNIWIATSNGLVLFDRKKNIFKTYNTSNTNLKGNIIRSIFEDSGHTLWLGIQDKGLHKIGLKGLKNIPDGRLAIEKVESEDEYSVYKRTLHAIYEDKDKNLWLGTNGDGVNMISGVKEKFQLIKIKQTGEYEGSYLRFWGMCADQDGNLWLGSDGDGIYVYNKDGNMLKHYFADGKKGSLTGNAIISAFKDSKNNLWFGSYSNGLFRFDPKSGSFINYKYIPGQPNSIGSNDVRTIYEDKKGNLWIGTLDGGLNLFNPINNTFKKYTTHNSTIRCNNVRAIEEDENGRLWIGMYGGGINYFDPVKNHFTVLFNDKVKNHLASSIIYSLHFDKNKNLWIGTEGSGLAMYETEKKILKYFTEKNNLGGNTIYSIQEDKKGNLWMSTNNGVSKWDHSRRRFYNYDGSDGLQQGQFNSSSHLNDLKNGIIGFGGTEGVSIFKPEDIVPDNFKTSVLLTGLQLFNTPVEIKAVSTGKEILSQSIAETKEIEFQYNQSVFSVEFTSLNYSFPEKTNFTYKMEGLDKDWNYVGKQRSATYRYLEPGNYILKVKATNDENIWGKEYTSIKVKILPPFWRTPQAYLVYFVIFFGFTYSANWYLKKQKRLRERLFIEKEERRKERLLVKEKLSFFTEVSHEFRTPLTLMIGPLEEMISNESENTYQEKKLKLIYKNANKLLGLINKLLDYRKIETGKVLLSVARHDLVIFIEEILETFKEVAKKQNIRLNFYAYEPVVYAWIDKEKVETILNNLISNSFKYLGGGNQITVSIKQNIESSESVLIEILDNGIGIEKEQLNFIFDWFYQVKNNSPISSGIGLALAKKLVDLHKGKIFVDSQPGKGSVFSFTLPIENSQFETHEINLEKYQQENSPIKISSQETVSKHTNKDTKKILIVEDDNEIRLFLKEYLQKEFVVAEAANGKEGLEVSLKQNIDIIITDVMMPVMDGIEFCKQIKGNIKTSHIPVIMLTAKTTLTNHKEGVEVGADQYLTKPFSPELLLVTINNLLHSRELMKRFYRNIFNISDNVKDSILSPDQLFLDKIVDSLRKNLDNASFNVNELCDILNMSRSILYKKIKQLTNLSPVEYLRSLRMQEAARLLKTNQYKIFEVVYMVGFNDIKYFRQSFIKEFGCPPSEYIKNDFENIIK